MELEGAQTKGERDKKGKKGGHTMTQLEWLDDLDALNQLKWPSRFADASTYLAP